MRQTKSNRGLILPTLMTRQEAMAEPIARRHIRWLKSIVAQGKTPIYIGDKVRVSTRWNSLEKTNPYIGKTGIITNLEAGTLGSFNIDYLSYQIKSSINGNSFEVPHYTLDLIEQTSKNKDLEEFVRSTNQEFERYLTRV